MVHEGALLRVLNERTNENLITSVKNCVFGKLALTNVQ